MNGVDSRVDAYTARVDDWQLAADLWGGTSVMRTAGRRHAPQFPSESDESYRLRIDGAVLFNAFRRTVSMCAGKAFQKPVAVGDDVPGLVRPYLENVDREGTHIDVFARRAFAAGVRDGARFVFVDMPTKPTGLRLDQERALSLRPYWVDVDARNLIGWRHAVVGGRRVLSQIRMLEPTTRLKADSEFEEETVERIRIVDAPARDPFGVVAPDAFTTYRVVEKTINNRNESEWIIVDAGSMAPLKEIPLAAFIAQPVGFMTGELPLIDLAHLNVAHWRSDSDQRYILHKARVPIGMLAGFNPDDVAKGIVKVAADNWLVSPDSSARAAYMEHSGAAMGAGSKDLEELENRMRVMGLELLVEQPGNVTATARSLDQAASDSELAGMVRTLEDCIENALRFTAQWQGVAVQDGASGEWHGGSVTIAKDFGISQRDFQELQWLLTARTAREISQATFLAEIQRRMVVSDDFDADAEQERLREEEDRMPTFDASVMPADDRAAEQQDEDEAA